MNVRNSCLSALALSLTALSPWTAVAASEQAQTAKTASVPSAHAAFNGVWMPERATPRLLTIDGSEPPLRPESKALYEQRRAARKAGDTSFDRTTWCASPGIPRLMFVRHPFEIAVSERRVAFLHSWSNWYRTVNMSGEKWEVDPEYSSVGVAMGHWDEDALVIETIGLRSDPVLDREGLPHSADLQLTERLRLVNENLLEVRFRFDDPATYTRPWETVMTYRRQPDAAWQEFICLDEIKKGRPGLIED